MLKALELSGFKSFADRTRLEFPRGISVVVGPNGSGKSNIVDAIKWVLGSQSAKSLRGKEMTDVIFNGCATRGPMGTGEVTLTFDNNQGQLAIDSKEVHVTRRVYRSGEGEYLINRQPCRLRDIRELLAGTGITTEAYCIIEQGKVDALLQSSPRDRRIIFEEAAGISQFKAKKAASLRRLERVDQNLLRLSDIVDEVESRVRSLRAQAGKARRYRECATRLQELRTEIGLLDWRALTQQISSREEQLAALLGRQQVRTTALADAESQAQQLERHIEAGMQQLRGMEAAASATREQIAAQQTTIDHQTVRHTDLQQEIERTRQQLAAMSARADDSTAQDRDPAADFQAAETYLVAATTAWHEFVDRQQQAQSELDGLRNAREQIAAQRAEALHSVALSDSQLATLQSQLTDNHAAQASLRRQLAELSGQREGRAADLASQERIELELSAKTQTCQLSLAAAERQLEHVRRELARADKQHRQLEGRLTRAGERIAVLSEFEQRLEGLDGGVQQVLQMARDDPAGPLGHVSGVVADLFHVDVDSAPLVEVALGERAQFIVLTSAERLLDLLDSGRLSVPGRIGFLRLDSRPPATPLDHVDLSSEPGVMGRADRFVEAAAEIVPLVRRLLGRTWLVDRLSTALQLAQSTGRGLEFVTSDGELLTSDGTLVVGPRRAVTGMLSRRSELRACRQQVAELEHLLAQQEAAQTRLDQDRLRLEATLASSLADSARLSSELSEHRQQTAVVRSHLERITHEQKRLEKELVRSDEQAREFTLNVQSSAEQKAAAQELAAHFLTEIETLQGKLAACEVRNQAAQRDATDKRVAVAKWEQRLDMLRHQREQSERNQQERNRAMAETRDRLTAWEAQLAELDVATLQGRHTLAQLHLLKQQHIDELAKRAAADETLRRRRGQLLEQLNAERQQLDALQSQQHKLEAAIDRLRHERQTLCERMQDDYGIDLAEAARSKEQEAGSGENDESRMTNDESEKVPSSFVLRPSSFPDVLDRTAVDREIAELRDQLNNIGAVNLAALDELESLEARFARLSQQYTDLVDAKASLEKIIQRIDADSRQLFLNTLEMIRSHFQELFRRLFGGGEADIVVDQSEDVLDSGIEIIARPPGKEACIISLLSGGEKTLTCVALLLAVFRGKPSPFCVLDEVDAALDEANIGRFVGVLREFLSFTQFVVVTHSKKTMAGGDTLYGITMEESGVSKRVSVRFEDVSEDGQILPSALAASRQPGSSDAIATDHPAHRRAA